MIDHETVQKLEAERLRRLRRATTRLLDEDNLDAAGKDIAWADTSARLISANSRAMRLRMGFFFACFCLLIVGLLWTLHVRETRVTVELIATHVRLGLAAPWAVEPALLTTRLFVNTIESLDGLDTAGRPGPYMLDIRADKAMTVGALSIDAGADVELDAAKGRLLFSIKDAPVAGRLFVEQAVATLENDGETIIYDHPLDYGSGPETIAFVTERTKGAPVGLDIGGMGAWRLMGLKADRLSLERQSGQDEARFESAIVSGTLTIAETKTSRELREFDYLVLDMLRECRRLDLHYNNQGIRLVFEGVVGDVRVGPKDYLESMSPRYLEYIFHHQLRTLFWGALIAVWTMLWRARSWFTNA